MIHTSTVILIIFPAYHAVLGSRYHAQSQTSTVFLQPGQQPGTPSKYTRYRRAFTTRQTGSRFDACKSSSTCVKYSWQVGIVHQTVASPFNADYHQPSPWSSPYSTGTSPSKVPLWTSGYDPSGDSIMATTLHKRSPHNRSPYSS